MHSGGLTRRAVVSGLVAGGLGGCGVSPTLDLIGQSFQAAGGRRDEYPLSADRLRALPYASLGVRVGDSAPAVMILATIDGDRLNWVSSDRAVLVTQRGRLVKTVGFKRDLVGTQWTSNDPVTQRDPGGNFPAGSIINRFIDVRPNDAYGVAIEARYGVRGAETIEILGRRHETNLVVEHISVSQWRWSTDNLFWVDVQSGEVLRSRQRYCPDVGALTLEILKPAAVAAS